MKFEKDDLLLIVWNDHPELTTVEDEIVDTTRWSILHRLVFQHKDGKFYTTTYSTGATEYQDETPFEYDGDEIECPEVFKKEKMVTVYE